MRACKDCRRKKIKCDAATTNTWPCSACIRVRSQCVPPIINYDRDFPGDPETFESERQAIMTRDDVDNYYRQQASIQQQLASSESLSGHSQQRIHYEASQTSVGVLDEQFREQNLDIFPRVPNLHRTGTGRALLMLCRIAS
jgi:hypothetical protein